MVAQHCARPRFIITNFPIRIDLPNPYLWGKDILVPPSVTFGQFKPTRFTIKTLQTHKVCILDSSDLVGLKCPKFKPCEPCGLNCLYRNLVGLNCPKVTLGDTECPYPHIYISPRQFLGFFAVLRTSNFTYSNNYFVCVYCIVQILAAK